MVARSSPTAEPRELMVHGFAVGVDDVLGHLWVAHDGSITWDELQSIKSTVWGADSRAIEVYPVDAEIVNNAQIRHLWRLGAHDFAPDLLGHGVDDVQDSLAARWASVWRV